MKATESMPNTRANQTTMLTNLEKEDDEDIEEDEWFTDGGETF
jgi:hypothetical protein